MMLEVQRDGEKGRDDSAMRFDGRHLGLGGKRDRERTAAGSAAFSCNDGLLRTCIRHTDRTGGLNEEHLPRKQVKMNVCFRLG